MFIKKLSNNHIILRLLLLFLWFPVGVFVLPKSDIIKHKFLFGLIYLSLWGLIGLPVLLIFSGIIEIIAGTMQIDEVLVLFEDFMQSYFQTFLCLFLLLLVSALVYTVLFIKDKNKLKKVEMNLYKTSANVVIHDAKSNSIDFKQNIDMLQPVVSDENSYKKSDLLTPREKVFYKELLKISEKLDYAVSTKVRFADLVNVNDNIKKYSPEWQSKFNKIVKKHIDFALIQKDDLSVKLLIELDDSSHYAADRQERDAFVDSVCNQAGVPILHVWNANNLEDKIVTTIERVKSERF